MTWGKKRTGKFNAQKVFAHGRNWPSKLELAVYNLLLMMERGGKLKNIECQVHVEFRTFDHGKIKMIPDFRAVDCATGEVIYIEAKGLRTPSYVRKEKAWSVGGPATLYVYGGHWQYPKLLKIVTPKEEKKILIKKRKNINI